MNDDVMQETGTAGRNGSYTIEAVVGLLLLVAAGLFVVNIASAFAADEDCNTYGGYTCADLTDAVLTVEPSTDLVDRQTVDVTGTNFDPHGSAFGAAQCDAATVATDQIGACDLRTSIILTVDGDGNVSFPMTVRRLITTGSGTEIDCAVEGSCVIGAGTLGSGLSNAVEGTSAPISFDPDVPPVPDLEIDFTVDSVTNNTAAGTVTCNLPATYSIDIGVQQTKGGTTGSAYGYTGEEGNCGVVPTAWSIPLSSGGGRRLVGGKGTFEAYAYAYDDFSSAFAFQSGEVKLTGGPRPEIMAESVHGEFTSVSVIGVVGKGADQAIELEVTCNRPAEAAYVSVGLTQWAGLVEVNAYGFVEIGGCDGITRVQVPLNEGSGGTLAGGPAQVVASVYIEDYDPPETYFFDYASATGTVKLTGQIPATSFIPEPNPNSRISITGVSRSAITGTIECDEQAMVFVFGGGTQSAGRTASSTFGFVELDCDGVTPFSIPLETEFKGGKADVGVSAEAYRIVGEFDYEYLWADQQSVATNVRGR